MVRFQTPALISIGLKTTLLCLIFRDQNYFENDISLSYICQNLFSRYIYLSVSFTKLLAHDKQILNKL